MSVRLYKLIGASCLPLAAIGALTAPAQAQINVSPPLGNPSDGPATLCNNNGQIAQSPAGGDCSDVVIGVGGPLKIGGITPQTTIVFDTQTGEATFGNTATFNGAAAFNGAVTFSNGVTFGADITANGITSTGGLTNTGGFTNNGSVTVTNGLTADSLNANSATIGGQVNAGSLVASGQVSGGSLFTSGNATVQGFFSAQNGASISGTTQLQTARINSALAVAAGATVDMGGNRVQDVGTPTAATDAANKAYVDAVAGNANTLGEDVAAAFGGGSAYDPATGHLSAPSYTVGTATFNNVGAAFNAANTSGLGYFHTNSTGPDSKATGANSTAIGPGSTAGGAGSFAAGNGAAASASGAIALGQGSAASGVGALAAGNGAVASANGAVAVGQLAQATGVNAIAIGAGAKASGSVAVGVGATAANGGAAYGDRAAATGANSAALGPDASATADNAVAIGSGSTANVADTVSFGTAANQRRLVNVAAGVAPSDATTMGQLVAGSASVAAALGGGSVARADGTISAPSYSIAGITYNNVGSALDGVMALSFDIRREERRGIAATSAMAAAPMPTEPGRTSWVVNTGFFHGVVAYGGSIAHRFSARVPLAVTAGFAYSKGGDSVGRVGMAGEF